MSDLSAWPALVLTAGLATRLRPLSAVRAKAAMPVAGEAIIGRILRWLRAAGVRRVVLNLHHLPQTITGVVGDGAEWDLAVTYSWEQPVLGSAGGPRRALPLLDADRFLIVNGDTLTDCDLPRLVAQHGERRARVTMAVVPGDVRRYGGVLLDGDGWVRGFGRPVEGLRALHFIGVQAVERSVFSELDDGAPAETVRELYPALIRRDPAAVSAYVSNAAFLDVGTPGDYYATVVHVASHEGRALDIGRDCRIDPAAAVHDCVLWDRVQVPAGASLANCVVADGVVVPRGSRFERCAIVAGLDGPVAHPFDR